MYSYLHHFVAAAVMPAFGSLCLLIAWCAPAVIRHQGWVWRRWCSRTDSQTWRACCPQVKRMLLIVPMYRCCSCFVSQFMRLLSSVPNNLPHRSISSWRPAVFTNFSMWHLYISQAFEGVQYQTSFVASWAQQLFMMYRLDDWDCAVIC